MTTREQLTFERTQALLRQLEALQNQQEFRAIREAAELGEAEQAVTQRDKAIDEIVTDYQSARSSFDTAVADYGAAGDTATRMSAVATAVQAQQSQIDEIVEYLVLTSDSL
ncbi:hypothetical protein C2R22_10745 [Salinigranum rubrum]|uniref:Uncharacterized protein n=1 Tax=Salinigranum rubrum TaxID=755307 RepID=A0A2I8VJF1_9EURY|nr:hypothetical protein [Salinigranum rubrum]AUV82067.1 hypothetical protein C2R22_10745 [Salinigranum rubrum]